MTVSAPWREDAGVQTVCAALESAGFEAWVVGGAVRNAVLGEIASDIDLTTNARPDQVKAVMTEAGLRTIPTGIEHGTLTVLSASGPLEITTFRRDVETDGRHAVIAFSESIAEDAARRDFTMNALYARRDGTLCDPLGTGLEDAKARKLRFIGAPEARIAEDYLRILRFFRFFAWYGEAGDIDADGLAACAELAEGLEGLSRERIGGEMRKLLSAPDPSAAVAAMAKSGVLMRILPGAGAALLAVVVHLEEAPFLPLRLAALGGEDLQAAFKLSNAEAKAIKSLHAATALEPREAGYRYGLQISKGGAILRAAAFGQLVPEAEFAACAEGAEAVFPVKAADLPLSGPALGAALKALEARWIASGMTLSRDDLLA